MTNILFICSTGLEEGCIRMNALASNSNEKFHFLKFDMFDFSYVALPLFLDSSLKTILNISWCNEDWAYGEIDAFRKTDFESYDKVVVCTDGSSRSLVMLYFVSYFTKVDLYELNFNAYDIKSHAIGRLLSKEERQEINEKYRNMYDAEMHARVIENGEIKILPDSELENEILTLCAKRKTVCGEVIGSMLSRRGAGPNQVSQHYISYLVDKMIRENKLIATQKYIPEDKDLYGERYVYNGIDMTFWGCYYIKAAK